MSQDNIHELQRLLNEMANLIANNDDPDPQFYALFFQNPELSLNIVDLINKFEESEAEANTPVYSACIFAFDICVAQLQSLIENQSKLAGKMMNQLMDHLADLINTGKHSLGFWLPVLNAFYEVHAELNDKLREAYFELSSIEADAEEEKEPLAHLEAIRDLILELSDLSDFEITENFFAQSYAMPPIFFADLIVDLYNIKEGHEFALLILLHPNQEVREVAIDTFNEIMDQITLSSKALTRLQTISHWYPESYQTYFKEWIKSQRKKGVVFEHEHPIPTLLCKATEIDGTGSQGLFIQVKQQRKNRLCGLLFNFQVGIKDVWLTPFLSTKEIAEYYQHSFTEVVTIREVDTNYVHTMIEHFLAILHERGMVPPIHFLEIQELLGLRLRPNKLDLDSLFEELSIQISPFTQEVIDESLQRSKNWLKTKPFTESWYLENPVIDKIVNQNCSFVEGVKVCRLEEAVDQVFDQELEVHRNKWEFHFLWMALWVKSGARKTEKIWKDAFLIAYLIHSGKALREIPVMQEICYQTVVNSVETMQDRRTYLSS